MAKSKKEELENEAVDTALEGMVDMAEAAEALDVASDLDAAAKVAGAAGVSDLTRAVDTEVVADRIAQYARDEPARVEIVHRGQSLLRDELNIQMVLQNMIARITR